MGNYNVGNETKNGSRCVCKWKGVVCLAGILISLVVGSFCVVTYGASAGRRMEVNQSKWIHPGIRRVMWKMG